MRTEEMNSRRLAAAYDIVMRLNNEFYVHSIATMRRVEKLSDFIEDFHNDLLIAGLLHDTLEEGVTTREEIRRVFHPGLICDILDLVSRNRKESYENYINRIRGSVTGADLVKIADIEANLYDRPLPPSDSLIKRYVYALRALKGMSNG